MSAQNFFTKEEKEDIVLAIKSAELDTSGEIRVHVEEKCKGDVKDQAAYLFKKLEMHKTEQRNGVLFYLAIKNRKFAILGDIGINEVVYGWQYFWRSISYHDFWREPRPNDRCGYRRFAAGHRIG